MKNKFTKTSAVFTCSSFVCGLPWRFRGKESSCQCSRCRFDPWVRKIPWRRIWQSTPVFLPGEFHGQRSLTGYSLWVWALTGTFDFDLVEYIQITVFQYYLGLLLFIPFVMVVVSISSTLIESESHLVMSDSLQPHGLYSLWNSSRPEYWSG